MAPSKEAMAAAEKIFQMEYQRRTQSYDLFFEAGDGTRTYLDRNLMREYATHFAAQWQTRLATAIDDHTAVLRADLQEAKTMNLEYEQSWQAVLCALVGKPFENPRQLMTIQIADALRAERDELKAKVDAIESDKAKRFNRLREEFEEERKQVKADIDSVRKSLDY